MRRGLTTALVLLTLIGAAPNAASQETWRWEDCRFRSYMNPDDAFNRTELLLVIRCGVRLWPVYGGYAKAVSVAECESGLGPRATNPNGHYGIYQFARSTFASVHSRWRALWERMGVPAAIYNPRSNILHAVRKASADGWGAWGCA